MNQAPAIQGGADDTTERQGTFLAYAEKDMPL